MINIVAREPWGKFCNYGSSSYTQDAIIDWDSQQYIKTLTVDQQMMNKKLYFFIKLLLGIKLSTSMD